MWVGDQIYKWHPQLGLSKWNCQYIHPLLLVKAFWRTSYVLKANFLHIWNILILSTTKSVSQSLSLSLSRYRTNKWVFRAKNSNSTAWTSMYWWINSLAFYSQNEKSDSELQRKLTQRNCISQSKVSVVSTGWKLCTSKLPLIAHVNLL
jgi:hypothetical protein